MSKWKLFSLHELRELQEVLSNSIENDATDLLNGDGVYVGASPIQERLLEEIYSEITERLGL